MTKNLPAAGVDGTIMILHIILTLTVSNACLNSIKSDGVLYYEFLYL